MKIIASIVLLILISGCASTSTKYGQTTEISADYHIDLQEKYSSLKEGKAPDSNDAWVELDKGRYTALVENSEKVYFFGPPTCFAFRNQKHALIIWHCGIYMEKESLKWFAFTYLVPALPKGLIVGRPGFRNYQVKFPYYGTDIDSIADLRQYLKANPKIVLNDDIELNKDNIKLEKPCDFEFC